MEKEIHIRKVSHDDLYQLQQIARQTFFETFAEVNTEEDLKKYLEKAFAIEKLTAELDDHNSQFYFAEYNSIIIGYLKVNFGSSQTELKDHKALEIERIYVLKEFHGQEIGQMLYEKAIHIAKMAKAEYVWLGVWGENARAISFYKKNGFREFDTHIFMMGDKEQTDLLMKVPLESK